MTDVFVSYSRRDSAFVRRLTEGLQARGKDVWVDVEGIRDAEVFPAAIRLAVERSDAFVFVISPDSVGSPYCGEEVDHAVAQSKRLVPLLLHQVSDASLPGAIRERNWIPFDDEQHFDAGVERVVAALDTDLEWTREHTRWLVKAREWEAEGREASFLLRGRELAEAEQWLAGEAGREPVPAPLHRAYIQRSRAAATRRLRVLTAAMALALAVSAVLGVLALTQRNAANDQRRQAEHESAVARSRGLAALSEGQLTTDPELAILLARQAVLTSASSQAMVALREALDGSALRLTLPSNLVRRVVFARSGTTIATASTDSHVRLWDARTGRLIRSIHTDQPANAVAFGPGDRTLLVAFDTGGTAVYDPASGRELRGFQAADHVSDVRYGDRDRMLVTAGLGFVKLWDPQTFSLRRAFDLSGLLAIRGAVSPDGRLVAAGTEEGLRVWDARTGRARWSPGGGETPALAFSPDGGQIAFGGRDHRVRLLATADGRVRTLASVSGADVISIAFSADGRQLAAGSTDGVAQVWDVASGARVHRFAGHRCCVNDVAFDPSAPRLATSSKDDTAKVWSLQGNALATRRVGTGRVVALAFSAGDRVVAGTRTGAVLWTPGGTAARVVGSAGVRAGALSANGRVAALLRGFGPVRILDTATGHVTRVVRPHVGAYTVALDAAGGTLAVGGTTGAELYSTATGRRGPDLDIGVTVGSIAFPARGPRVATAWDEADAGRVSLWNTRNGHGGLALVQPNHITAIAFSPGGDRLLGATEADDTVKLWSVGRHAEIRELYGHTETVTSLAFSPDARLIATASIDHTARVWDARTGAQLHLIRHARPVWSVAFSRDGTRLATGDDRGTVRVWDACGGCFDPRGLLALAGRRVTRQLTPLERRTFGISGR